MITKKQFVKALIAVLAVNAAVIVGIVFFVNSRLSAREQSPDQAADAGIDASGILLEDIDLGDAEYDGEDPSTDEDRDGKLRILKDTVLAEESYDSIYKTLLPGSYILEDGKAFIFSSNGVFSGYFNEEENAVDAYSYALSVDGAGNNIVTIYNHDRSSSVVYILGINTGGDIILRIPDSDQEYLLGL